MVSDDMALAEKLTIRRARVAQVLGILFIVSMATSLSINAGDSRPVNVQLIAWAVWAAALFILVIFGGALLRGKAVRTLMNDEVTAENRLKAQSVGFIATVLSSFLVYGVSLYEPVSAQEAIRLVLTVAVGAAAISFGTMEKRSLAGLEN